ncbi:MAG: PQQ-binding-like beta-propeller repeat protein [Myxococcaceae bacterium]|nr:PQQ-binding-like beta-propeller repeat protein [Myxococcaceae bacterium]
MKAKARRIKCPHCGANLKIDGSALTVTCEFCGTTSALEGGHKQSRPAPPVPAASTGARAGVGWETRLKFFVPMLVGLVVGGYSLARVLPRTVKVVAGMAQWQGTGSALLLDVNGDGTPEVVGRTRRVQSGDTVTVSAFDATSGKRLWESPAIGTYSTTYQQPLAAADTLLLAADDLGQVFGIRRANGEQAFAVNLGEPVKAFCRGEGGALVALTTDGNRRALDPAKGTASFINRETSCEPLVNDAAGDGEFVSDRIDLSRSRPRVPGMHVKGVLAVETAQVVVGTRGPGRAIPVAARVEDKAVIWMTVLPEQPALARDEPPALALATQDGAFALYESRDDGARLVRLNLADGGRVWDVEVPTGTMNVWESIIASRTHVYVSGWGRLDAFDVQTGAHAFRIGH